MHFEFELGGVAGGYFFEFLGTTMSPFISNGIPLMPSLLRSRGDGRNERRARRVMSCSTLYPDCAMAFPPTLCVSDVTICQPHRFSTFVQNPINVF